MTKKQFIPQINILPEDSEPLLAAYADSCDLQLMPFGEHRSFVFVPISLHKQIEDLPSNLYLELRGKSPCCDRFYRYLCHWGSPEKVKLALLGYWR